MWLNMPCFLLLPFPPFYKMQLSYFQISTFVELWVVEMSQFLKLIIWSMVERVNESQKMYLDLILTNGHDLDIGDPVLSAGGGQDSWERQVYICSRIAALSEEESSGSGNVHGKGYVCVHVHACAHICVPGSKAVLCQQILLFFFPRISPILDGRTFFWGDAPPSILMIQV